MTLKRRTIKKTAAFEGIGIHSGHSASVTVLPLWDGTGIRFRFGGDIHPITDARPCEALRSTSIAFPGGQRLRTVEHLLGALAGLSISDAIIEAQSGTEFPILDGSALPYVTGLTEAGIAEKDVPADVKVVIAPICVAHGASSVTAIPSETLRVTYMIDYPGTAIGTAIKDAVITPESFAKEVAPARTFALMSEVEHLRKAGLAAGGTLANTLVFGENGPLNDPPSRMDGECAAHKILDLLGDLALNGNIPTAHYICVRGGHRLHLGLAARLAASAIK
ncbi:MAG: UDP-3-O-acyl-N-acetylglucosamine deacetylase [Synergistaceae bacterium]|jgi:UDP-3-O-[3-hydroxymyristoyl] N-acetylglucosamine deacetylase|nr:UDP-3-O-acyl-N-acetylglucosamine deacetylase [Synergistaceae bacterium]